MAKRKNVDQSEAFIRTARELGCDEDPEVFERVFARIVPPKTSPEPQKRAKRTVTKRRLTKKSSED
jgi:hypothetical protein